MIFGNGNVRNSLSQLLFLSVVLNCFHLIIKLLQRSIIQAQFPTKARQTIALARDVYRDNLNTLWSGISLFF